MSRRSEDRLFAALRRGEAEAWSELLSLLQSLAAQREDVPEADREDLASEVLMALLLRTLDDDLPQVDDARAYLFGALRRRHAMMSRRRSRRRHAHARTEEEGEESEVERSPPAQDRALVLQQVLRDLRAKDQALLRSRYVEGASYSELSRRLRISRSAVHRRMDRLLPEIRARAGDSRI